MPGTLKKIADLCKAYPTLKDLALVYNPNNSPKFAQYPSRCITGTAPTLVDLNNAYGSTSHIQWLIAQLATFQEGINTPNKMTPQQLSMLAQTMATDFFFLKLSEVMLFLARLAGGSYDVDFHGYVSPDAIIDALKNRFMPYRASVLEDMYKRDREEKEREEAEKGSMTWEEFCMKNFGEIRPNPLG